MDAEARGTLAALQSKAQGFSDIVGAAGGADEATLLLVTEQLPQLVEEQVKAIANLKIDSVTVWDSGKGEGGKNDTANFVSGLVGALPPLHELTKNVGIELPEFLGKLTENPSEAAKLLDSAKEKSVGNQPKKARDFVELRGPVSTQPKTKDDSSAKAMSKQSDGSTIVRSWLSENLETISAFDENRDNRIDEAELETAVNLAMKWGESAKNDDTGWYFLDGSETIGPVHWNEVQANLKARPDSFVTRKGAKHWLPAEVVVLAMES
jgi:hypothetical protein